MKNVTKRIIAMVLTVALLLTSVVIASAEEDVEYLSAIRLVYADDVEEAKDILVGGEFEDYEILPYNLNAGTGEIGVYLAYLTTTDVNDAITDLSVIQMDGGYRDGNYQQMIEQSYDEYVGMSEVYLRAIEYFALAYNEDAFLADCAYRQLNLYADYDDHDGMGLGDLFVEGIDATELATIFMEGNANVLRNLRSLLAMGVSYNESGLTYLEQVAEAAALMEEADEFVFEDAENFDDYDDIAYIIASTIGTFKNMFEELEAIEDELNFEDDEHTELEIQYMEYVAMAGMTRNTEYLGGESFYDFCLNFELDEGDLTSLYPLVYALNDGQLALTQVAHFYDVVRYSVSEYPEEEMDEEIAEVEEKFADAPFDIYSGVDRSIYRGSFALTSDAYRADSYSEQSFGDFLFNYDNAINTSVAIASGAASLTFLGFAAYNTYASISASNAATKALEVAAQAKQNLVSAFDEFASTNFLPLTSDYGLSHSTFGAYVDSLCANYFPTTDLSAMTFYDRYSMLNEAISKGTVKLEGIQHINYGQVSINATKHQALVGQAQTSQQAAEAATQAASNAAVGFGTAMLYLASGIAMLYTAVTLGVSYHYYKNPDYSDVPVALVDMLDTVDGNRFIKYDVVYEAMDDGNGGYSPADLNAFEGQRWNALYYTKSYEAGRPLLADFSYSLESNVAEDGYAPVHRFGEEVCYNLNRYNFGSNYKSIFLSVRQSSELKDAEKLPELVGSMLGGGGYLLSTALGIAIGVGATTGIEAIIRKKRKPEAADAAPDEGIDGDDVTVVVKENENNEDKEDDNNEKLD